MPAPGMRVGSYEVVAPIGKGGMGEVWRGRDARLGRDVALKFVAAAGADRLARFEHEARTLAALNHPNICVVYDVGPDFIAMELVEGGDRVVDTRSDQFSFGLILYELVAGRRAFKRDTAAETLSAIIREDPPPLSPGVPATLCWIVDRCLAKEPRGRYDTTHGLYLELSHLRDHVSERTGADTGAMSPLRARRWPQTLGGDAWVYALFRGNGALYVGEGLR